MTPAITYHTVQVRDLAGKLAGVGARIAGRCRSVHRPLRLLLNTARWVETGQLGFDVHSRRNRHAEGPSGCGDGLGGRDVGAARRATGKAGHWRKTGKLAAVAAAVVASTVIRTGHRALVVQARGARRKLLLLMLLQ